MTAAAAAETTLKRRRRTNSIITSYIAIDKEKPTITETVTIRLAAAVSRSSR